MEQTGIKTWKIDFADERSEWEKKFSFIYHSTRDKKLTQFSFKFLHRILVTKKELFKFRLADDETCFFCSNQDSIEHTFLECFLTKSFYSEALTWFNHVNTTDVCLSNKQIALNDIPGLQQLTDCPRRRRYFTKTIYLCVQIPNQP